MTGAGGEKLRKRIAASSDAEDTQHGLTDGTPETRAAHVGNSKRNIFRFTDLPAELRSRIYDLSLTTSATVCLTPTKDRNGRNSVCRLSHRSADALGLIPNLLLVNKATYAEGGPVLYANKFSFDTSKGLFVFIASLSPMAQSGVQDLTLQMLHYQDKLTGVGNPDSDSCDALLAALTTLIGAPNLKRLHLRLTLSFGDSGFLAADDVDDLSDMWEMDDFAKLLFPHAHLWLDALGTQKGSREKAVEVIDINVDHVYWPDGTYTTGRRMGNRGTWNSDLRKELLWKLRIR